MKKEIKFEKGDLIIGYCQDFSAYETEDYSDPIKITFIPNIGMTEQKCLEYTNENMPKIIEEVKIVITENNEFYENFEIDFNSEFLGYQLYRDQFNRHLLVSKSWMILKCNQLRN